MATISKITGYTSTSGSAITNNTWESPIMDVTNISNPPTEAELIAIFGTAESVGSGFMRMINDAAGDSKVYIVASTGVKWISWLGTVAS